MKFWILRWSRAHAPLLLALTLTTVVHGRALGSNFWGEDLLCFFQAAARPMTFLSRPYAGQMSTTFGAVVIALRALFDLHAPFYFAFLVCAHLANVAMLFAIVRALSRSPWASGVACALWGTAPAFQGTLQWFSAVDHVLGVTATLFALRELSRAAEAQRPVTRVAALRMNLVLLAGAGAAGVGFIGAVLSPALAYLLLPRECGPRRAALWLLPSALLSILMVVAISGSEFIHTYQPQATSPKVIQLVRGVVLTFVGLVVYGVGLVVAGPVVAADETGSRMGLIQVASAATPVWVSSVFVLPAAALIASRLVRGDGAERRALVALLGLAGATYALVAFGRGNFGPIDQVAWVATRDRYQYIGTPGLVIALAVCTARAWPREGKPLRRGVAALLGALTVCWTAVDFRVARDVGRRSAASADWTRDYGDILLGSIDRMRAHGRADGALYVSNDPFRPAMLQYALGVPRVEFPGIAAYWITARGLDDGQRPIRFVEHDATLLAGIRNGYPSAVSSFFVAPQDVAPSSAAIHTIGADAPPDVAEYLARSVDPGFGPGDPAWATRVRQSLAEAKRNPAAPWRAARPTPVPPQASPPLDANVIRQDPAAMDSLRKAIRQDANAMDALRKAIQEDPAAMEDLRKAMQRDQPQPSTTAGRPP